MPVSYTHLCIMNNIYPLLHTSKEMLIAQTYVGANIMMCGSIGGVKVKIREVYPFTCFVHCYDYELNLLLEKATSVNNKVRVFSQICLPFQHFFTLISMNGRFGGSSSNQVTQSFYNKMELQHSYSQRCVRKPI